MTPNVSDAGGPIATSAAVATPVAVSIVSVPPSEDPLRKIPSRSKVTGLALAAIGATSIVATRVLAEAKRSTRPRRPIGRPLVCLMLFPRCRQLACDRPPSASPFRSRPKWLGAHRATARCVGGPEWATLHHDVRIVEHHDRHDFRLSRAINARYASATVLKRPVPHRARDFAPWRCNMPVGCRR